VYVLPELQGETVFHPYDRLNLVGYLRENSPVAFSRLLGDATSHYYLIVDAFELPGSEGDLQLTVNDPVCADPSHCGDSHTIDFGYYSNASHGRSYAGFTRTTHE
jgi:hypothetical protein